jgi:hypothetical protein
MKIYVLGINNMDQAFIDRISTCIDAGLVYVVVMKFDSFNQERKNIVQTECNNRGMNISHLLNILATIDSRS